VQQEFVLGEGQAEPGGDATALGNVTPGGAGAQVPRIVRCRGVWRLSRIVRRGERGRLIRHRGGTAAWGEHARRWLISRKNRWGGAAWLRSRWAGFMVIAMVE
jgi:hypothetical protein